MVECLFANENQLALRLCDFDILPYVYHSVQTVLLVLLETYIVTVGTAIINVGFIYFLFVNLLN